MKAYQQRVIDENAELNNNRQKLIDFMHGETYPELSAIEQGLFMVQLVAMNNYSGALSRRIELF